MKKIFTAIATIIVTRFIIKAVDRITHPEELRKEYEKAEQYRKKLEADRMRRLDPKVNAWMGNIGTVGEMAAQYKENIPPPKEPCDHAALRPCSDLVAMDDWHFERLVRSLPKSPNEDIVREWRKEMRKDPLIIQAAKAEATPMDWGNLEYDPDLIKHKLL